MKVLEIPLYISLASLFLGMFLAFGANIYGIYQLQQSGKHWDWQNGYGICPNSELFSQFDCVMGNVVNTTIRYVPPRVMVGIGLVFTGFGSIAMLIGDQSERIPFESETRVSETKRE